MNKTLFLFAFAFIFCLMNSASAQQGENYLNYTDDYSTQQVTPEGSPWTDAMVSGDGSPWIDENGNPRPEGDGSPWINTPYGANPGLAFLLNALNLLRKHTLTGTTSNGAVLYQPRRTTFFQR